MNENVITKIKKFSVHFIIILLQIMAPRKKLTREEKLQET